MQAVRAGGIGSVASAPHARGLGLPSALLHDALAVMARDGAAVSFLFTGIPAFYERLGWRIVTQPGFDADSREAASMAHDQRYAVRRVAPADLPAMLSIYRGATAASTGAIVRTQRTWSDAQRWLGEDARGCLLAASAGRPVAYLRARSREYGYHLLEAAHLRGDEAAINTLVAHAARRAIALRQQIYCNAPVDSALALALRSLPSTRETADVGYPTMMRIVGLDALATALLPHLDDSAKRHPGVPFTLGLRAHDEQSVTLDATASRGRLRRTSSQYMLDEASTLDALLGQRRPSELVRPRPPSAVRHRIDALLPETPFHFWNSDRI